MTALENGASNRGQDVDICVVGGGGHVGLPLAIIFAASGMDVLIHDINEAVLETIATGELPAMEFDAEPMLKEALAQKRLYFSADPASVARAKTVVVTIGTPIDSFLDPVHRVIESCFDGLLPHLRDGQLIILRSTVFPGSTDWVHRHLEKSGKRLHVAFCPERVVQGHSISEIREMPQIVAGTTPEAEAAAADLFMRVAPDIVRLTPMEAEFAKLFNNAYRYIQFAITNQFYMIADAAGVDYYRVLHGMTHNYPRARGIPGAGFTAGPCLFKDTMQLVAFARNQFGLGHAAMLVNEGLVHYVIDRLRADYTLEDTTVGLVGMAFKADIDDTRASLSYKMKKYLVTRARAVLTTDPHVTADADLMPLDDVIEQSDVLVLCAPHSAYKDLDTRGTPLIDVWNFVGGGG